MEADKKEIDLPLIALGLDVAPVLVFSFLTIPGLDFIVLLLMILLPAAGLITGIVYLSSGKGQTDRRGKTLAIIAISLPLVFVLFILSIFGGLATGVISGM